MTNQTLLVFKDVSARFSAITGKIRADLGSSTSFAKSIQVTARIGKRELPEKVSIQIQAAISISPCSGGHLPERRTASPGQYFRQQRICEK